MTGTLSKITFHASWNISRSTNSAFPLARSAHKPTSCGTRCVRQLVRNSSHTHPDAGCCLAPCDSARWWAQVRVRQVSRNTRGAGLSTSRLEASHIYQVLMRDFRVMAGRVLGVFEPAKPRPSKYPHRCSQLRWYVCINYISYELKSQAHSVPPGIRDTRSAMCSAGAEGVLP